MEQINQQKSQIQNYSALQIQNKSKHFQNQRLTLKRFKKHFILSIKIIIPLLVIFALIFFLTSTPNFNKIVIVATNDIHGTVFPIKIFNQKTNQSYNYGGLVYLARLIEIIKKLNPHNVLYLDAGDQFQGAIQGSPFVSQGQILNDYYKITGLNGSAIGNHQFDFGKQFLFDYLENKKSSNLAANLINQNKQQNFLPRQKRSQIYTFKNGIKIGVIGLSTISTPYTTRGFISGQFPSYQFLDYPNIVIQQSKLLKNSGAHAVIILAHAGIQCKNQNSQYGIWNQKNQSSQCTSSEMITLIDNLPEGTIDGIIQGHQHHIVHKFYKGIPISGSINQGVYFNAVYLTFDYENKIIKKQIEGPIPVCQKIFQKTKRCQYIPQQNQGNQGKLSNWQFHGEKVYALPKLVQIFDEKWSPKMKQFNQFIVKNQILLKKQKFKQSELGNLISLLMHNAYPQADFTIINSGGFRQTWYPGDLSYKNVYGMFPFSDNFVQFSILGRQLKDMIKTVQGGTFGHYPTWGLIQKVKQVKRQDSNPVPKRQLLNVKFRDRQIIDDVMYKGITIEFILQGGDDFKNVIGSIYNGRDVKKLGLVRDTIVQQLKKIKLIKKGSLINQNERNFIIFNEG